METNFIDWIKKEPTVLNTITYFEQIYKKIYLYFIGFIIILIIFTIIHFWLLCRCINYLQKLCVLKI